MIRFMIFSPFSLFCHFDRREKSPGKESRSPAFFGGRCLLLRGFLSCPRFIPARIVRNDSIVFVISREAKRRPRKLSGPPKEVAPSEAYSRGHSLIFRRFLSSRRTMLSHIVRNDSLVFVVISREAKRREISSESIPPPVRSFS